MDLIALEKLIKFKFSLLPKMPKQDINAQIFQIKKLDERNVASSFQKTNFNTKNDC